MKISLIATLFFFFLGFSSLVKSQTDSCTSTLNLTGIPFLTTSLSCQSVWKSQDFILRYEQIEPSLWNFILSAPNTNSYVAIGFSDDGKMVGSSSIVGWVPAAGNGVIKQYYLGGTSPKDCLPDKGSLKVANETILSQSSRLYLAFQLSTDQPKPRLIYAVGPEDKLPSSSNYLLSEHQSETSRLLDFGTAAGKSKSQSPSSSPSQSPSSNPTSQGTSLSIRTPLGVLTNILGWAIIFIIG